MTMSRVLIPSLALLALTGCKIVERVSGTHIAGESNTARSNRERDERAAAEKKAWPKKCKALFDERRTELAALVTEVQNMPVTNEATARKTRKHLEKRRKELFAGIPYQCGESEEAKQAKEAFRVELMDTAYDLRLNLVRRSIDADAPTAARTTFYPVYQKDVDTPKESYRVLAQDVARLYDAQLLKRFQEYGWCRKSPNKVLCAFSDEPFPEDLSTVTPTFATHLESETVNVLARLPLPAKHYANRHQATLSLELVKDEGYSQIPIAARVFLGEPGALGDTEFVRASFELPPEGWEHTRFWFDARVVLRWKEPQGLVYVDKKAILVQSSFSWHSK